MKLFLRFSFLWFSLALSVNAFAQPGNTCAMATGSPVTLPYTATGQTTCGYTDNFNGTLSCASQSSSYTTGPDHFYAFTAAATGMVTINLTNVTASSYPSITVFQGCPSSATNATNCIGGTNSSSGPLTLVVSVVSGTQYVIMIDNWPTPACTSYDIHVSAPAAAPAGDNCATAIAATLPYCATGQTTCGFNDNYNGTVSCAAPSSIYTTGPDVFYKFTAAATGQQLIQLTNTSPATFYGSIIVFQGCPSPVNSATNCVGGTSASSGNFGLTINVTAGVTYYVMIDNWPTPACFNYDICISPPPSATLQAACTNLGFESGTTGWFGTTGSVVDGAVAAPSPTYNVGAFNTFAPQISVTTAGADPIGGFPMVFAGAQSMRIGDGTGTGSLGASLEQLFQVTAANANFTYNYAVVLEDGTHPAYQQPFFQVEVFDQSNNPIACGNYLITAPGTGFTQSTAVGYTDTWYKAWTPVSINLLSYVGQNVRVKFTCGDCSQGGHFGYAYVDCSCAPWSIPSQTICVGSSATLTAPVGALTYSWSPGGSTAGSITVSPASTTVYTCNLTSQGTTPCSGVLTTTVTVVPSPTTAVTTATICPASSAVLTASGATTYSWSPGTGLSATNTATVTANPAVTTVYTVTGTSGSCTSIKTTTVTVVPNPTVTVNSPTICKGNSATLTAAGATTYSWSAATGLSATTGASVTANPTVTTTYTIVGTTGTCTSSVTSIVTVNPLPTVTVNSPTVCTGSSVNLTAAGASTYTWNTGSSANPLSVTPGATSYTVTGTSAAGCTNTAVSTLTVVALPVVTVNSPTVCNGSSVNLTAAGASTYTWNTGSSANPLSVTPGATSYTVTGTSAAGCTNTAVSTVTVIAKPVVTVNSPTVCNGSSVNLTAAGASTYTWNTGSSANPLSVTPGATSYTVTGTSAAGCTNTAVSTVTVIAKPVVTVNSPTVCNGSSVNLTAAGASTYTWNTGSSANPLSVTPGATSYTVTGTSAVGCTNTAVSTVTVVALPVVTVNSPTVCSGFSTNITAAGASTYTWNTGSSANPLSVTPGATSYTVTGTSAAGCTNTAVSTVTVVPNPTVTATSVSVCPGAAGTITASGATTYTWNTGATTAGLTISPGATTTYTVTGTTAACTATAVGTITVAPSPTVTVASVTICPGSSTGLTAAGASTYTWAPAATLSSSTGTSVTASPTVNTTYTITGTSVGGCTATTTASVTIGGAITPSVASATICAGGSTTLNASGGTTYTWSPATGLSATTGASVTATPATTTTYTINAASGACTGTTTAVVTVSPLPTVTVNSPSICINANTTLTANGATTYVWSPATGLSATTGASVTANPTVTTTYTIVGTTSTCTAQATSVVTVNPLPTVTVNSATVCPGASATLTAAGASTYTWNTGATGASITATPTVTTSYTVTGTSAAGCVNTATASISVLTSLVVSVNSATLCTGSSTTLNAAGAATYSWVSGTGLSATTGASVTANPVSTTVYTVTGTSGTCSATATSTVTVNPLPTITVNTGTICIGQTTANLTAGGASTYTWSPATGLSATTGATVTANPGTTTSYTVTGTDANGCVNTNTTTVTVNPTPTITVNNATYCTGGSAVLTAAGASTYTWSPATGLSATTGASVTASPTVTTNYTITGTSAAGCVSTATTSVSVVTTPTITANTGTICIGASTTLNAGGAVTYVWSPATGLSATTGASVTANPAATTVYTITGTAGTCTGVATTTVTVNPLPTITVNTGTICIGQTTTVLTAGGASSYTWSPATGLSSANGSPVTANPATTTSYTVTGTDANGCVNTNTTSVTVNPLPTITVNNATYCTGGSAVLTAGGASTYTWSLATGLSSTNGASVTASPTATTNYTITATDANGCVNTNTTSVTVVTTPTITANTGTICIGASTTLNAGGAVTYVWSPATGLSATTGASVTANPTVTTVYTVTGTAGTCTASATTTVTVNPLPTVTVNTGTICIGQTTAVLTAGGATTYTWSPATGLSSANGTPVTATPTVTTSYTVTGTDANGCVNTNTTSVTVNPLPTITANSGFICNGSTATLNAGGASTYTWSPATGLSSTTGASVNANPTSTIQYTITGTDANGCVNNDTTTVTVVTNPTVTMNTATICIGTSATLTANGASTYVWSPATGLSSSSGTSVTANPTVTTVYTITGTAGTCTAVATTTVTVNPLPVMTVNSGTICVGQQTATLTAGGASTYVWSPSTGLSSSTGTSVTATPTTTTSYTVIGTDANGCVDSTSTSVTVNTLPVLTLNSGFICNGSTVTLNAGGASTYTWSPATGLSATTGASVNANPTSTIQYTIVATDANGCTNTDTTTVTVVTNPTVTVNSSTICVGQQTATLTANGAVTYVWSPATGLSATTGTSVNATPNVTTVYTITGTAGTCTAVATTTVTVNTLPIITANSGTICVGQTNATLNANGAVTYVWNPATGLSASTGASVIATPVLTTSYTVIGTDANGCFDSTSVSVTVNPLPTVTLASALICVGGSTPLTAGGAATYSWSPGTGLSATTGATVTANPATTTQYTVVGVDANGCINGDTATVTVVTNPVVSVASATICAGSSTTLTANGATTYTWSPAGGLSSTSGSSVTANPVATAVYTIDGTVGTCTATTTATVTVNSLPTVTVNSGTICVGQQTATLTAAGASTYVWSPPATLSSSLGTSVIANPVVTTPYTITGTDVNGCVNTATTTVTVNPLPIVTFSGGLICLGTSMSLNAAGAATYSWIPGTGLSATTGASVTANPVTTTQYTLIGVDANGCVSGDTASVFVVANPVISVASSTICAGNAATLIANGAMTYTWSPAAGLSATSGSNVSASPTVTSVYTIDGTVGTCTATTTATVTVNALPVITIGSNSPVCVNQTLNLTSTGGPGYTWSGPNAFASSVQNPGITGVTVAASGMYSLMVIDANSCVSTATVNVVINPLPIVSAAGSTVCLNATASLTAGGGVSYSWSGPGGFVSNNQNPTIPNATGATAGTYIVTVTDVNGCANANVAQIAINSLPTVSANALTICAGGLGSLTGSGANTYVWTPTTGLSSASGVTVLANPSVPTSYTVTGTDGNGCQDTAVTFVDVIQKPILNITPSISAGCAPVCVSFTKLSAATGTCNWMFGDGGLSASCTPSHCFSTAGVYYTIFTLIDANGCKNTDTSVTTVYPMPIPDFTFDPQPTTILDPLISFHNLSTGALITSNVWTFGDPLHSGSTIVNPNFTYQEAGSYPVQLVTTTNHGCKDSITKTVVIENDYFIYVPNAFSPNADGINETFFAKGEGIKDFKMYIFDRWGNQIFFSDDIYKGWDGRFMSKGETIVQEDVYVWKIELKTFRNEAKMLKGTVSLIK
jgi:gliding motility-associated-like protein